MDVPGWDPAPQLPERLPAWPVTPREPAPPAPSPRPTRRSRLALLAVVVLLVAGLLAGFAAYVQTSHRLDRESRAVATLTKQLDQLDSTLEAERETLDALSSRLAAVDAKVRDQPDPAAIAAQVQPSVFTIEAGNLQGTGFVVSSKGRTALLVTNFHVVKDVWDSGGTTVQVSAGSKSFDGRVVDVSQSDDVATIRVHASLPALEIRRQLPAVGSLVLVFGSPEGLEGTVANGIVSALRDQYIQFSAPVSPGNSGGPLVDGQGRVLGITTAKIVQTGAEGLSFAIPIDMACRTVISC
jgi:putative serine protease PepD